MESALVSGGWLQQQEPVAVTGGVPAMGSDVHLVTTHIELSRVFIEVAGIDPGCFHRPVEQGQIHPERMV
jgi:hypothetical protein